MPKFELRMIETLYHTLEVEAENEEELRRLYSLNELDWSAVNTYDSDVEIDEIIEMVSEEDV
jgi:hypothetical protein